MRITAVRTGLKGLPGLKGFWRRNAGIGVKTVKIFDAFSVRYLMHKLEPLGDPQTYAIIGAAMEVHRELGAGFLESVYRDALEWELSRREIPFRSEVALPVFFKGQRLASTFRADVICYDGIVVELKAIRRIGTPDVAQVLNYLKASKHSRGLLLNFGCSSLEYRRVCLPERKQS
jgi:GxxExxY protein